MSFIKEVLDEAVAFVDRTVPETFKKNGDRTSSPASAKVAVLSRDIKAGELPPEVRGSGHGEAWFARRSRHANKRENGTANIQEFDHGLRADHSQHEMEYTPDVIDAHKILDWDELIATKVGREIEGGYGDVTMAVYEMCHHLPFPVANRTFPVLILTAKTSATDGIVVQIPIDTQDFPDSRVLYTNGRNRRDASTDNPEKRKKMIPAVYVSIERIKLDEAKDEVEWVMATASDAKGWLPMFLQKMGIPGAVVKDVGLFVKWNDARRGGAS